MTQLPQPIREGAVRTRQPLSQARHMPAHFYTSPEIYEREKERIFQKEWLCMGRVEELDQPGSYLTFRVAGEPIVICKDRQGEIRAFSNVCRHRGTQIAFGEPDNGTPFGKGCDKALSCPYHGWTYDMDGRLLNAPHSAEMDGFDTKDFGLIPLRIDTWAGFLFINFDPAARGLMDVLNEMDFPRTYQPYRYEDFRLASKFSFELDCNWKFVNENLTDIYHIAVLHVNTFGPWQPLESYEFRPVRGAIMAISRVRPWPRTATPCSARFPGSRANWPRVAIPAICDRISPGFRGMTFCALCRSGRERASIKRSAFRISSFPSSISSSPIFRTRWRSMTTFSKSSWPKTSR